MIGIEINNEFLDLLAGVVFEIVRNSPYFNNDEIEGEFSLPVGIPYTDKNYRLLSYIGNHYKTHSKTTIAAKMHGGPNFIYDGSLVIDAFEKNANLPNSQLTNGLFVFGISSFFQQVKDKKLSDLQLGGVRTFNWTTNAPYDGSGGFWQHVLTVSLIPADYTFIPIKNDGYGVHPGDVSTPSFKKIDWMNMLAMNGHTVQYFQQEKNIFSLCPAISVVYLIKQVFEENGWTCDGEVLTDTTFVKLFAQSFRSIYWCDYSSNGILTIINKPTVDINLQEHVPPGYKITDFIIDLKNRYGLSFSFDTTTKNCTISFLKNIINGPVKDITAYCNAPVKSKFDFKERIISLKNTLDSSDVYPLTFEKVDFPVVAPVRALRDRPAASGITEGHYILVFEENTWYQCVNNESLGAKEWQLVAENIGNYIVPDETEAITTNICTFATAEQRYRIYIGHYYFGYFPTCDQPGNWYQNEIITPWALRTLLHHGPQLDRRDDNTTTNSALYAYGSAHTSDNNGNDLGGWSNIYQYSFGTLLLTINNGIYEVLFKDWLNIYKNTDSRNFIFTMPFYMLFGIKWEDIIYIKNVRFLIKNIKFTIPYNGTVQIELLKMDA